MAIFLTIVAVIGAALVFVLVRAALAPNDFQIARATMVNAPADKIYPLIANLRRMNEWNPFAKDAGMEIVYSGPESGTGARHDWDTPGNKNKGDLEITDAAPNAITMRLHMIKPMEATNKVVFGLEPMAGGTEVSWTMTGSPCFLAKVMHTVFNMDRMVGGTFAKGLADLKIIAER